MSLHFGKVKHLQYRSSYFSESTSPFQIFSSFCDYQTLVQHATPTLGIRASRKSPCYWRHSQKQKALQLPTYSCSGYQKYPSFLFNQDLINSLSSYINTYLVNVKVSLINTLCRRTHKITLTGTQLGLKQ